jgi:bifunctional non-homologous end joining protein LigD
VGLAEYRRKRNFRRSPEPAGATRPAATAHPQFVVQKHAASRLHYDFRLEAGGVLKSWAVPKGPSLDPAERRLAVEVEDHPVEYGSFEGIIPKDEYGGGTVLLWDHGTWIPDGDVEESLRRGKLSFRLEGKKLHGGWTLVRLGGRNDGHGKPQWLLMKRADEAARPASRDAILSERPESVASGRSLDEIARRSDRTWTRAAGEVATAPAPAPPASIGRKAPMPTRIEPELATLVADPPAGDEWLHEVKFDGYRVLCRIQRGAVRLLTRRQQDWTERMQSVAATAAGLPVSNAILDGEVVALEADGRSSFQALQRAFSEGGGSGLVYYAFDLLYLDGHDLRAAPLEERKRALEALLQRAPQQTTIRYSDHVLGGGEAFHHEACRLALEGVVAKRRDAPYHARRSRDWLKVKCAAQQELVICGFTDPSGSRVGLGALLLGVHEEGKGLRYAGKVGTGFDDATLRALRRRLGRLEQAKPPFAIAPRRAEARGAHWVKPELVAEIAFTEWTEEGRLRHPRFLGLREDKAPEEVKPERPARVAPVNDPLAARLTHPDRVLYPRQGLTKLDLARYYEAVAERMLPHVVDRPLTLVRCPRGHDRTCFFQKHAEATVPPQLRTVEIEERNGRKQPYLLVRDNDGLIALVQMGVLELHVGGSRASAFETPDHVVFDLDPAPDVGWSAVVEGARRLRDRLRDLGLASWVKTTGGKGLHVVVPVSPRHAGDVVEAFARAVAEALAHDAPGTYALEASKARRKGKIFLDTMRNGRGATAVAPYSPRAREGAPVATPITWDELSSSLDPAAFTVATVPERLSRQRHDPWEDLGTKHQALTAALLRRLGLTAS